MSKTSRLTYATGHGVRRACRLLRHLCALFGPLIAEYCRDRGAGNMGRRGPAQFAFLRDGKGVPRACASRLVAEACGVREGRR